MWRDRIGHKISRNVSGIRGIRRPGAEAGPVLVSSV